MDIPFLHPMKRHDERNALASEEGQKKTNNAESSIRLGKHHFI